LWLKADLKLLEIDFRFAPNTGHTKVHAGLLLLTHSGHSLVLRCGLICPVFDTQVKRYFSHLTVMFYYGYGDKHG